MTSSADMVPALAELVRLLAETAVEAYVAEREVEQGKEPGADEKGEAA